MKCPSTACIRLPNPALTSDTSLGGPGWAAGLGGPGLVNVMVSPKLAAPICLLSGVPIAVDKAQQAD